MNPKELSGHLVRAFTGPMWHGSALAELLADVRAEEAATKPLPGAHSIWELVLHMATWAAIVEARLRGDSLESPPPEVDWRPAAVVTSEGWSAAVARLESSYRSLAAAVGSLSEEQLQAPAGVEGQPAWVLVLGVVEHACYHGGQIPLLRKALRRS